MTTTRRVLTGITTTGTPHLGNYVGAIRPAIAASREPGTQSFYFLADYHALIKCDDPARIQRSTLEIAATWLAAGLDPEQVTFYRQSDIPEIPELMWLLTCVTGKGLLNRAHAYKASVDKNTAAGAEPDADVTAGLFMYPVLMAADIMMFQAHKVPVGRDQVQHIEMARDMAASFNHLYGEHLVLPEAQVDEDVATLPGLDGRKMSKSYNNTIPLFVPREQLRRLVGSLLTDSRAPGEPKDVEGSALFQIYQAFATPAETAALRQAYADGIAWGDAKALLFEKVDAAVAPMRQTYETYLANPARLEEILKAGAAKARHLATPYLATIRQAAGLRPLQAAVATEPSKPTAGRAAPAFKQYREKDGLFYFKLVDGEQATVLQSHGYANPREAAAMIARLKAEGFAAYRDSAAHFAPVDESGTKAIQNVLQAFQEVSEPPSQAPS
ncbi:MAG: Tryptophan--tRNA ligase [Paracidovorax wautersii]|uniref:Tryptophan--tRNA ligase n=1 Tax=Paracidovorax wautersii TaxID=1177982 RepID=A0A7V8JPM7_9BURK|nr:MAG: Tryptophan--tRNA ligase [Paracidovorax wautersii]